MSHENCQASGKEDYYSSEKDKKYMSCSQFAAFADECELAAYKLYVTNEKERETKDCFLEGNFGHSAFEGDEAHKKFRIENADDIFSKSGKTKGELKAPYKLLEKVIETAKGCEKFMSVLRGQPEVEYEGTLFGERWKIRVDNIDLQKNIFTDIKFVKSIINEDWVTCYYNKWGIFSRTRHPDFPIERNQKVPFYEAHNYWRRAAVYQAILEQATGKKLLPLLAAISKETPPDLAIISMANQKRWEKELHIIKNKLPRIMKLKRKKIKPVGCGICEVCREERILTGKVQHFKAESVFYNEKGE